MVKKLLFVFLFITSIINAQDKKVLIKGKVIDSLGMVKNANIVNLNTNQGTSSSNIGEFEIFASLGDSLRISSIQHKTRIFAIGKYNYDHKIIIVPLKLTVYTLDEFDLKRHNLTGRIGIDLKKVPTDKKDSLLRETMDFSKIDMSIVEGDDYIDSRVRPPINNTDPTSAFAGAGAAIVMPFQYSKRLWVLRRKLAQKKALPSKIMSELGEYFFFKQLKIPVEKYYHFLEYCNPLGIEDLHQKGKNLEVIKILRRESVSYLKIIKKQ